MIAVPAAAPGPRLAALLLAAVLAAPPALSASPAVPQTIEHCIGPPPLHTAGARAAWLDDEDRVGVAAALQARFPALGPGFSPQRLLLLQRGSAWLYVSLHDDARRPGGHCYDASFAAERIDATPALLRKYFGIRRAAA